MSYKRPRLMDEPKPSKATLQKSGNGTGGGTASPIPPEPSPITPLAPDESGSVSKGWRVNKLWLVPHIGLLAYVKYSHIHSSCNSVVYTILSEAIIHVKTVVIRTYVVKK